jgi:hypothetical protein
MNTRVIPPSAGTRWGGLLLALLLPSLASAESEDAFLSLAGRKGSGLPLPGDDSRAYLRVVGPPPLQFLEPDPLPQRERSIRTPETPPTKPANMGGAVPAVQPSARAGSGETAPAGTPARPEAPKAPPKAAPPTPKAGPPPILPDEGGRRVRPEDFLPFFQFPGGVRPEGPDSSVSAPPAPSSPGALPPSSATYRQE